MLFPENFFHFWEKYHIFGKFFGIPGKFFSYLGKNVVYPGKCFWYVRKIFEMTCLPVANISGKKFLDALFYSKSAPQSLPPPQLLEASYAL